MDRKTGSFTRLTYNPAKPEQLSRTALVDEFDHITFITEDADRKIWIGTLMNGVIRYDPSSKKIDHYGGHDDRSGILKDSTSWCATPTPDGLVWLSTQRANLFKIDLYNTVIPYYASKNNRAYFSFSEENDSITWYGTNRGLIRKNMNNGAERLFVNDPHNPNSLSGNYILSIAKDKQGNLWLGTDNGLNHFTPGTGKFARYYPDSTGKTSNALVTAGGILDSNIWAAIWTRDGLGDGLVKL